MSRPLPAGTIQASATFASASLPLVLWVNKLHGNLYYGVSARAEDDSQIHLGDIANLDHVLQPPIDPHGDTGWLHSPFVGKTTRIPYARRAQGREIMYEESEQLDRIDRTFHRVRSDQDADGEQVFEHNHAQYHPSHFSAGQIFRVWQPGNDYIHKKTMLMIADFHAVTTCLPVRCFTEQETRRERDFPDRHARITSPALARDTQPGMAQVRLEEGVIVDGEVWVNLQEPFQIRHDVRMEQFGTLDDSFLRVIQRRYIEVLKRRMRLHDC